MEFKILPFNDLSNNELYDLLKLRTDVFVVEQNCPYPELDQKDKLAYHYIGLINNEIVATSRILPQHISYPELSIGRVATQINHRGKDLGKRMMHHILDFMDSEWNGVNIKISAQSHLEKFYSEFGFEATGKKYLEDGIPHIEMLLMKVKS